MAQLPCVAESWSPKDVLISRRCEYVLLLGKGETEIPDKIRVVNQLTLK